MMLPERPCRTKTRRRSLKRTGLSKAKARSLLDWLEANGLATYKIESAKDGFTVAYFPWRPGAVRQIA
jgi:hypothetical protein